MPGLIPAPILVHSIIEKIYLAKWGTPKKTLIFFAK